jgi:hypothetical protein
MDPLHALEDIRKQTIICIVLNAIPVIPLFLVVVLATRRDRLTKHAKPPSPTGPPFLLFTIAAYFQLL